MLSDTESFPKLFNIYAFFLPPYRDIAMAMASHTGTFGQHCSKMAADKEWIDASVLHALGCHYRVDVAVWQAGMDMMIVGISLTNTNVNELALINIAMINDLHFWGVRHLPQPRLEMPALDNGDRVMSARRSLSKGVDDSAENADVEHDGDLGEGSVDPLWLRGERDPNCMDDIEMQNELQLCRCLMQWNPWVEPTEELISAMQVAAPPSSGSVGSRCCRLAI